MGRAFSTRSYLCEAPVKMVWSVRPTESVQQLDNRLRNFPRNLISRNRTNLVSLFHFLFKPAKISDTSGKSVGSFYCFLLCDSM